MQDRIALDERIQTGQKLIDTAWLTGRKSVSEIKAIISEAFSTDKEGNINTLSAFWLCVVPGYYGGTLG